MLENNEKSHIHTLEETNSDLLKETCRNTLLASGMEASMQQSVTLIFYFNITHVFLFLVWGALAIRAVLSVAVVEKSTKRHFNIVP